MKGTAAKKAAVAIALLAGFMTGCRDCGEWPPYEGGRYAIDYERIVDGTLDASLERVVLSFTTERGAVWEVEWRVVG